MHIICIWVIWSHHRHIYLVWFTVRQRIAMIKTRIQCTYIHFGVRTLPRQVFLVLSLLLLLGITTHDLALLSVAKQEFLGSRSCLRKAVERPLLWHQSRWQSKSREPMLIYERPPKPPTIWNGHTRTLILDTIMKLSGTIGVTQKTMTFETHVCQILLHPLNPQERWGTHKKRWPFQPRPFADAIGLVRCSYIYIYYIYTLYIYMISRYEPVEYLGMLSKTLREVAWLDINETS